MFCRSLADADGVFVILTMFCDDCRCCCFCLWCVAEQWTVAGNLIHIKPNEHNQMQAKKVQENIQYEDVLKVIHVLSK